MNLINTYALSSNSSYQNIVDLLNTDWIFWQVGGESDGEKNQLSAIVNLMKQNITKEVSAKDLQNANIDLLNSNIIKRLIKNGLCRINQKELTLIFPYYDKRNLYEFLSQISEDYHSLFDYKNKKVLHFPTTYLKQIDPECYTTIFLEKFHWYDFSAPEFANKFLEVVFENEKIPPLIVTPKLIDSMIKIAKIKVQEFLIETASLNIKFFQKFFDSADCDLNKNDLIKDGEVLGDIEDSKYRERFTRIFFERVFANEKNIKLFLYDFDIDEKTEIKLFFPVYDTNNIDLYQSIYILKEFFLSESQESFLIIDEIASIIAEATSTFVTYKQIKNKIQQQFPDVTDDSFTNTMNQYENDYVSKTDLAGESKTIKLSMNINNEITDIYFTLSNFDIYINNGIKKIDSSIKQTIIEDWTKKIKRHSFAPEMFLKDSFNSFILTKIKKMDERIFQLMKNKQTYYSLARMTIISKYSQMLLLNGEGDISKVFSLNSLEIYNSILKNILDQKSILLTIIFKFLHWLSFKNFTTYTPVDPNLFSKKSITQKKKADTEEDLIFLNNINYPSFDALEIETLKLWNKIPNEKLSRQELDTNIAADLTELLKNKKDVRFKTIFVIIDRNINRILQKAPHLESYSDKLYDYIKNSICLMIHKEAKFRCKISF